MRNLPPLSAIRVFESAARHGNFTRAAEELNMTQAAVSYQMRVLEERIGVSLFHRVKRRVELTEIGARIAPLITRAFDNIDDAFAAARADNDRVLTISCSQSFSTEWLAVRLGKFQLKHPEIAVRLDTTDRVVDLAASDVDVAIRTSAEPWPDHANHFLMRTPLAPMAHPDFLAQYPVNSAADILALRRISPNDLWWNLWAAAQGLEPPAEVEGGIRLDSQVMDANAAKVQHGVAILNPALFQREVRRGDLVRAHPAVAFEPRHYWLVYPEHKRRSAKISAFRDWILDEFAEEAARDTEGFFEPPQTF